MGWLLEAGSLQRGVCRALDKSHNLYNSLSCRFAREHRLRTWHATSPPQTGALTIVTYLAELPKAVNSLEVCVVLRPAPHTPPPHQQAQRLFSHTFGQQFRCPSLSHPRFPHSLWPSTNTLYTYSEISDIYFPTF